MSVRITIIGLGQIGGSFGLALADQKEMFQRVGHDAIPEISRMAQKLGAVDQVSLNLPASVRNSDVVLLALPIDQIRETIEIIAPDLKEDVVVLDTAPVKEVVTAWAKELLPPGRHYVGLSPVLNTNYLHLPEFRDCRGACRPVPRRGDGYCGPTAHTLRSDQAGGGPDPHRGSIQPVFRPD